MTVLIPPGIESTIPAGRKPLTLSRIPSSSCGSSLFRRLFFCNDCISLIFSYDLLLCFFNIGISIIQILCLCFFSSQAFCRRTILAIIQFQFPELFVLHTQGSLSLNLLHRPVEPGYHRCFLLRLWPELLLQLWPELLLRL